MSEFRPIGSPASGPAGSETQIRAAIARAADATGVDFDYLLAQAKIESSLNPAARAGTSSAAGLYQFTGGTWLSTLQRHGAEHGLGWAADPAQRAQAMALRYDPQVSALMAAELARDNKADLTSALGREPDSSELYLAHFLGSDGAAKFLNALAADPSQSAAALLPNAASANRGIFFGTSGPRSVSEVMGLLRGKVSGAMEGGSPDFAASLGATDMPLARPVSVPGGPIAQAFHAAALQSGPAPETAQRVSMADTLRQTFALDGKSSSAPGHVRTAYARLAALGF